MDRCCAQFFPCLMVFLAIAALDVSAAVDTMPDDPAWHNRTGFWEFEKDLVEAVREEEADGDLDGAAAIYEKMADVATHEESRYYARCRAADLYLEAEKYDSAAENYRDALKSGSANVDYGYILGQMRSIARAFEKGENRWFGTDIKGAVELWEEIVRVAPLGPDAPADSMHLAFLYEEQGEIELAKAKYRSIIRTFPQRPVAQEARLELARLLMDDAERGDRDAQYTRTAADVLQRHREVDPDAELPPETTEYEQRILDTEAQRILELGRFYTWEVHYRPAAARRYLSDLLKPEYAGTPQAEQARELLAELDEEAPPATTPPPEAPEPAAAAVDPDAKPPQREPGQHLGRYLLPIDRLDTPEKAE